MLQATCYTTASLEEKHTASRRPRLVRYLNAFDIRLVSADTKGIRRQTVEHPFGTLKAWMGATHFLTRTIERVSTEMSLHVLAYNMKRVIKLLGSQTVMKAMQA
jgi:hypothetical protein